jgi:hypothetical protein
MTKWEEKKEIYEKLLEKTRSDDFIRSYEKLDKEYREIKYLEGYQRPKRLLNFIDKHWWGYTYNKHRISR